MIYYYFKRQERYFLEEGLARVISLIINDKPGFPGRLTAKLNLRLTVLLQLRQSLFYKDVMEKSGRMKIFDNI